MKSIDLYQVDVFTNILFKGNPAGIVTNADILSVEEMKEIAGEMNLDETAFVLSPTDGESKIKLRFFTPKGVEIPFTGHATVGTLYELAKLKQYGLGNEGRNEVKIQTGAGILNVWTEVQKESIRVIMKVPKIDIVDFDLQGGKFAEEFGISEGFMTENKSVMFDRHLKYVYVPIKNLTTLSEIKFNFPYIREHFIGREIILFCLYTPEGFDKNSDIHSRVVAPLIGFTEEDSFTGSTQAVVCTVARAQGLLDRSKQEYCVEQGDFIGTPGRAKVIFDSNYDAPLVSAGAVHVFSTKIIF